MLTRDRCLQYQSEADAIKVSNCHLCKPEPSCILMQIPLYGPPNRPHLAALCSPLHSSTFVCLALCYPAALLAESNQAAADWPRFSLTQLVHLPSVYEAIGGSHGVALSVCASSASSGILQLLAMNSRPGWLSQSDLVICRQTRHLGWQARGC